MTYNVFSGTLNPTLLLVVKISVLVTCFILDTVTRIHKFRFRSEMTTFIDNSCWILIFLIIILTKLNLFLSKWQLRWLFIIVFINEKHCCCYQPLKSTIMSLIKPTFMQAANSLCHVSMPNRNALSLFLKVLRDMSVDRTSSDRLFQTTGALTEKLWSVICPRAWDTGLTRMVDHWMNELING